MYEHDGCVGCKYVTNKENDYPCTKCKCNGFEEDMWTPKNDSVNHPNHYCQDGSIECIDEMIELFGKEEVMSFCKLNVWKYRKRACFKNGEEDMKKSDWYMKKYIELKIEGMRTILDTFEELDKVNTQSKRRIDYIGEQMQKARKKE